MRRFRTLLLVLALACAPSFPAFSFDRTDSVDAVAVTADVLRSAGFGDLFLAFGQSIAGSPRQQGVTDERFLRAWERGATTAFGTGSLDDELAARLGGTLDPAELTGIADFLASPLGVRVASLEHATQTVPADAQLDVLAKGQILYWRISDLRRAQLDELMHLSGAEVSLALITESLRAAAVGLHMARDTGDLDVPWEEIDDGVNLQLSGMKDRLVEATRATFAYTYESLSDGELEAYLAFLRAPAAQKFYGTATLAVGDIIRRTMLALGQSVADRLNALQI